MAERVPKCINNKKDEEHPPEGYYSLASLVPRPVARQAREGAVSPNVREGVVQAVNGGHVGVALLPAGGKPGLAVRALAPLRLHELHNVVAVHVVAQLRKHAKHAKGEPRKNLESVADINEQRAYGRLLGNMGFNGGEAKHNRDLILEHFSKS